MPSPATSQNPPSPDPTADAQPGSRAAARQQKRRDLLKSYYGIGEGGGGATGPKKAAKDKLPDPLDIDNHAFNAELHLNKLLNEMSLPDLIQRDNYLVTEIKQLDGDMKTLVYENYNKFISATDTIRSMKTNVENMEAEMDLLSQSMTKFNAASGAINRDLMEERKKLNQLNSVDNLLKKLHFVFELPSRLHECVDKGQYSQAVRYYARVASLLDRYQHMAVFKKITEECRTIIDGVSKLVKDKLHGNTSSLNEIAESVGLLLRLNATPPADLAREYREAACFRLTKIKQTCLAHMHDLQHTQQISASDLTEEPLPPDVRLAMDKIIYFDDHYVRDFSEFVESYTGYFLQPNEAVAMSPDSPRTAEAKVNVFAKLSPEQQVAVRGELVSTVDSVTKEYIEEVEKLLQIPEDITKLSPLAYIHVLDRMHKDVQSMEPLKRIGRMDKRVNAMSFELLSKVVTAVFAKIKKEFFNRYKDVTAASSENTDLNRFVKDLNSWMKNTLINQYLPILERFVSPNIDFMKHSVFGTDDILDQIQRGLDVFWLSFTEDMVTHNDPPREAVDRTPPPPVVTLMMSRSALDLSLGTVEGVMSAYTDVLFSRKGDGESAVPTPRVARPQLTVVTASGGTVATGMGGGRGGTHTPPVSGTSNETMLRARDISGICKATAQRLLTVYVERLNVGLTQIIQIHMETTDWERLPEPPTALSEAWTSILDAMAHVDRDVAQLYQDDGGARAGGGGGGGDRLNARGRDLASRTKVSSSGHSRTGSASNPSSHIHHSSSGNFRQPAGAGAGGGVSGKPGGNASGGGKFDPMWSNIDKLFAERVEYHGPVEMTRTAVLTSVSRVILKCFVELVRVAAFNAGGFQQTQLDVELLKTHLWQHCSDERLFNSLLDEVLTCAYRRCLPDPPYLDYGIIDSLVSTYN
ncbi:Vacuolar protein sorting-associated protein 51 [Geranomyces variabilis]|nr:Vacuolar protein sorting-associated protein 51 [Geranomyces variabilis]